MTEEGQEKIWQYFQGEGIQNFDEAVPRLDYLFNRARIHGRSRKLRVLNIGVGNGWLERRCLQEGWDVSALDPGEGPIKALVEEGIDARTGVIENMPFENSSYDVIFCSEVLEHLDDAQLPSGLAEIRRTLKSDGILIGTVPYRENLAEGVVICPDCGKKFHRWGHRQSFNKERLNDVFVQASMKPLNIQTYAFPVYSKPLPLNRLRQRVRWVLGRLGSGHVYTNLLFFVLPAK